MSKHTPGPWRHGSQTGANANTIYAVNGKGPHDEPGICSVYGIPLYRRTDEQMRDIYDEGIANAKLIAAAPELLEALERTLSWLSSYPGEGALGAYDQARSAIAKATGVS